MASVNKLSTEELSDLLASEEDFTLLDVRPKSLYDQGHITKAQSMTLTAIRHEAEAKLPDKHAKIVLYCHNGRKSSEAARSLVEQGYTDVYDTAGLIDWPYVLEKTR